MSRVVRRRKGAIVAAVAITALLAAGCSSGGDDAAGNESTAPEASASAALLPEAEGTVQYPLTLDTWAGEVEVEARPERVAVIGSSANVDSLAAIGVTPVFAEEENVTSEWLDQEWVDGIEVTATSADGFPYEAIASAEPDLIIAIFATGGDQEIYDNLAAIAPVLAEKTVDVDAGNQGDWRLTQQLIGETLDLTAASEQAIADTEEAFEEQAAANPQFADKTVTMGQAYSDGTAGVYNRTGSNAEQIMTELGFAHNPASDQFVENSDVSAENLALLNADALLLVHDTEEDKARFDASEVFQQIPAVTDGRYSAIVMGTDDFPTGSTTLWILRRGASTIALQYELPRITDWLGKALPA